MNFNFLILGVIFIKVLRDLLWEGIFVVIIMICILYTLGLVIWRVYYMVINE